jgi:hypothetical protein
MKDLGGLYDSLQRQNEEAASIALERREVQPGETPAQVKQAENYIRGLFETSFIIIGAKGERILITNGNDIRDVRLPSSVDGIMIDTGLKAQTATQGQWVAHRAQVYFDFRRSELIDLSNPSGDPTRNISTYRIDAEKPSWAAQVSEILADFFKKRTLKSGWLHSKYTYDVFLLVLGIPMALWASFRLGQFIDDSPIGPAPIVPTAARIYVFILALYVFRILFSVVRWIFPQVMLKEERQNPGGKTRTVLGGIVLGVVVAFVTDGIKLLFGN